MMHEMVTLNEHFLPVYKRKAWPAHVVLVIADSLSSAEKIARRIAAKTIPEIYLFECDCRAAWRALPSPLAFRHHPYRVCFSTRLQIVSFRRLDQ